MSGVRDILEGEIGTPMVMERHGATVYGRITGYDGEDFFAERDGDPSVRPILLITTPHGSTLKVGRVWCHVAKGEELDRLREFENEAREKGEWYDGKLPEEIP